MSARHYIALSGALALIAVVATMASCASTSYWAEPMTYTGPELYETFCANCHGRSGRGDGPVAPLLKAPVPNLTHIAARNGGRFPADEVYRYIDGQAESPTHGPRNMPVWGYEFYGDDPDDQIAHKQATRAIDRLVKHVRSLQRPE
jgi:mono/diheme cytochrome c family protein